jgi:hypothetical protein
MDRDKLSPHTKFLYVVQRLSERFYNIKRRQQAAKARAAGQPIPQDPRPQYSRTQPSASQHGANPHPRSSSSSTQQQQAQGLQLLSEVAMSGNAGVGPTSAANTPPSQHHQHQPPSSVNGSPMVAGAHPPHLQHQSPHHVHAQHPAAAQQQGWYQPTTGTPTPQHDMALGMPGPSFEYQGPIEAISDYDLGFGMGLGMDATVAGLFMGDGGIWGGGNVSGYYPGWQN